MAFVRPTLTELVDRIEQDFVSRLSLAGAVLRRSLIYVLSRVVAGAAHMLHGHLEFVSRQIFPDLSEDEFLLRQAGLYGMGLKPATFAAGSVNFWGTPGTTIPAGTVLRRADGIKYATDIIAVVGGGSPYGTVIVAATAIEAGEASNTPWGTILSLESPIAGIGNSGLIAPSVAGNLNGIFAGSDTETIDELRVRLLDRMRSPPHGGNKTDYVAWALEVAGVTRAWCYPLELGPGTVTVRFVRDDDDTTIIPDAGEVLTVQNYINALAPVTAVVTVAAPIADALNVTVTISPNNAATRAAVTAELTDLIRRISEPASTIPRSQIEVAVGIAEGVTDFVVTVPAADVTHATGHMATMGVVTFA